MNRNKLAVAVATCCAIAGISAHAASRPLLTHHVPAAANAAQRVADVPAGQRMNLAITLPLHHQPMLDRLLRELQDPHAANYRTYLSVAEFTSRFGPTASEYATLKQFAVVHGLSIKSEAPNRFVLDVEASAATIEQAFGVHLGWYRHPDGSRLFMAPDREPTMDIAIAVLHVSGLDDFEPPTARSSRTAVRQAGTAAYNGSGPNGSFTGSDIRAAYYGGTALTGAGQTLALVEYIGFNIADVQAYFSSLGQTLTVPVVGISVDGSSVTCTGACDDFEPSIDIEQAISLAPGLHQISFYVGNTAVDILNRIATDNTAKQISCSYGWGAEAAVEDPVYQEYAAQGQSFVDGSGDKGSKLLAGGVWPADDANVTGVGGTDLSTQTPGGAWLSETAWSLSGGGPSPDNVKIPAWQKPFVNSSNKAAALRRNVPDVAAEANYDSWACYDLVCRGNNGGTSFAAPRWAGFIALVNQQAMSTKKTTVGFLNVPLYALAGKAGYGSDFHDITSGNNGKYFAVTSYDLVTGLGSPQAALIGALVGQ